MYTVNILKRYADLQQKKLYVDFEYLKDGVQVATEQHEFGLDATLDFIKRYAYGVTKRLEAIDTNLSTITEGELDIATAADIPLTADKVEKNTWFRDFNRLMNAYHLVEMGVFTGNETAYVNLKNTVKNNFKVTYLKDM